MATDLEADVRTGGKSERGFPFSALLVPAGLMVGLLIRVWVLSTNLGAVDQDEAVVGLMARRILDGEHPVFFWGQAYGGSQEAAATAIGFAVAGSSWLTLKLVPLACHGVTAWLVWRVGKRTMGDARAPVAAVVFWVGPAFFVLRSTRAYGFYGVAIVISVALLLAVLRLIERVSTVEMAWLGFLVGAGWWATPQIVFVAAPAVVWLVIRTPRVLRRAHVAVASAVVGSLPWWLWNLDNGWRSLQADFSAPNNSYLDHFQRFFNPVLPTAVGLRIPYNDQRWVLGALGIGLYLALLGGFAVLVWRRPARLGLLIFVAAAYPFLYSVSPTSFYTSEPRYLFLLSPVVALLWARLLVTPVRQALGVAVVAVLCVHGLAAINWRDEITPRSLGPLLADLRRDGRDRLYTPYVIAHRITFDSEEQIVASPIEVVRYEPYNQMVRASPAPAYVFPRGWPLQAEFEDGLRRLGVPAGKTAVGTFDVYRLETKVLPETWKP